MIEPKDQSNSLPYQKRCSGAPVRVKLKRINAGFAQPHSPDGDEGAWLARLQVALGTASSDFVKASLYQLMAAARLPCSGISALAINAALAFVESLKPRNEMEAALALQMACTHGAIMMVLGRFEGGGGGDRRVVAISNASARLLHAYAAQAEAFRRLRNGSSQFVRVEHVHVNEGGQAIIGNVSPTNAP